MKRYHVNLEVVARDANVPTHTQDLFSLIIEEEGEVGEFLLYVIRSL